MSRTCSPTEWRISRRLGRASWALEPVCVDGCVGDGVFVDESLQRTDDGGLLGDADVSVEFMDVTPAVDPVTDHPVR